ncbi:MAG TPA: hypothetical protein VNP90_02540 [Actinomycetota bacterium]|nr:hypothetical protein [Actinomycetota bacterium]
MDDVRERLKRASCQVTLPDDPFGRLIEKRDRRRRRQRSSSAVLAIGVAAAAVGGGLAVLSDLEKEPSVPAVGRLSLRPGEYFYLRIRSSEAVDGHIRNLETWWATDGSGEVRNRSTRQDKYPTPPSGTFGPGEFPINIAISDDLSSDPDELSAQLHADPWAAQAAEQPEGLWDVISHLLLEAPNAPADVRAALFAVAKDVPGVTTIEGTEDRLGRSAVALEFSIDGGTWTMHFDPRTQQMIAWSFSYKGGRVSWIVLESGIVESPGARPRGDGWLVSPLPPAFDP